MEACIEALFTIEGENGRKKTIEMIRVLKGAISVSKSRTGEVIYHYNRHEKKALRRQLAKYDRDTRRSKLDIEQQKRDILRKWSLVFGRQRNFCESIRGFDDMLAEAIILRDKLKNEDDKSTEIDDEDAEPEITEEEKARLEEEERKKQAIPTIEDPRKRRLPSIAQPAVPCTTTGMLPKINMTSSGLFNSRLESEEEERARLEREAEEERKRKAKELPRFDTEEVKDFLKEQKHMHEDLLTRNALMKIKTQADNDHVFFKYRIENQNFQEVPTVFSTTSSMTDHRAGHEAAYQAEYTIGHSGWETRYQGRGWDEANHKTRHKTDNSARHQADYRDRH